MSAALLLSGGMDSIAIAYWVKPSRAFTIDYGQKSAEGEIRAASAVANELKIPHEVIQLNCNALGSGDLAGRDPLIVAPMIEWWPYRNQFLVTVTAMRAIAVNVDTLLIGTVSSDSIHADGRMDFLNNMDKLLAEQEGGLRLFAPAIDLTSTELVRKSNIPLELLSFSHSCHRSSFACGRCRGCTKHYETMKELGYDPF